MWNIVSVHIPENVSSGSHLRIMSYIDKAGKLLANAGRESGAVFHDPVDPNFNNTDVTC